MGPRGKERWAGFPRRISLLSLVGGLDRVRGAPLIRLCRWDGLRWVEMG